MVNKEPFSSGENQDSAPLPSENSEDDSAITVSQPTASYHPSSPSQKEWETPQPVIVVTHTENSSASHAKNSRKEKEKESSDFSQVSGHKNPSYFSNANLSSSSDDSDEDSNSESEKDNSPSDSSSSDSSLQDKTVQNADSEESYKTAMIIESPYRAAGSVGTAKLDSESPSYGEKLPRAALCSQMAQKGEFSGSSLN